MTTISVFRIASSFLCIALCLVSKLSAYSIVFIHIGPELPSHLSTSIEQARLFNEECSIFLIANERALKQADFLERNRVTVVPCESLKQSVLHTNFITNPDLNWGYDGLFIYSSERFFYLEELMQQYNLCDVFHLESDVMLYADLKDLLPVFKKRYQGMIGAIFEHDRRCVPSFLYVSNLDPIAELIRFYPKTVHVLQSDMETLADFKNAYCKVFIDHLPIVVPEYANDHLLEIEGVPSKEPECYSNLIDEFGVIFDGAAWGIYLAGWDPRWHPDIGGTVSEYCVFKASFFNLDWKVDHKGRRIPLVSYKGKQIPIVNLHITNKSKIKSFYSLSNLEQRR
jgi:hypothetical protein